MYTLGPILPYWKYVEFHGWLLQDQDQSTEVFAMDKICRWSYHGSVHFRGALLLYVSICLWKSFFAMADDVLNSTSVLYLGLLRYWCKDWAFFNFCTWKYHFMYTYIRVYQTIVYAIEKWMHRKEIMQTQGRHIFSLGRTQSESILMTKWKLKVFFRQITRYTAIKLTLVYSQSTLSEHQDCDNTVWIIQSRLLFYGVRTKAYFRHKRSDLFGVFLCHCRDNSYMLSQVPAGFVSELKLISYQILFSFLVCWLKNCHIFFLLFALAWLSFPSFSRKYSVLCVFGPSNPKADSTPYAQNLTLPRRDV